MTADAPVSLRLLVVDDDELDRVAVRRCLLQSGMAARADEATSAAEALERIGRERYDCILLDYYLPGVSGLALLGQLRAMVPGTPVVIFTGRGDEDVAVELMKAGAADYLPKASLTPERLASGVRHALEVTRAAAARRHAEDELRTQEARFRTLANAIPQLAWMADANGQRHWFNQRWFDYTGMTPGDVRDWQRFLHPDHVQRVTEGFRRSTGNGEPWEDTYPLRGRDGSYRWFLSRALPIADEGGAVVGWLGTNTDVTESKRAEGLLRLSNEAAKHLLSADDPDELVRGLFEKIKGPLGVDAYVNHMVDEGGGGLRLASCAGIPAGAAAAIRDLELGESSRHRPVAAAQVQHAHEPVIRLLRSLGMRAHSCEPLMADYRLLGTLSFASRTKDAFTRDELEFLRTVSHYVTAAWERLRYIGQLREGDRRKDEFLATLAHELRAPLAPLRSMLEVMKRADGDGELLRKAHETMERQVSQLVRLVDDLLDVSRITRNKIKLRKVRVDLASVVSQAVEAARPLAEAARHDLTVALPTEPVHLHADPVRLAQVITNLLTNSCKYTEPGGRIRLAAERHGPEVVLTVDDTGIGIPPDKLAGVFDMFAQVHSALERSQGGLGIGLTLVKRLVEMHGGTVEAKSDGAGRGSRFVVRLPVVDAASQVGAPEPPETAAAATGRRILVVDDNVDSAASLAMLLDVTGNTTQMAHDGVEALEAAERFRPDVVLLDIGLPKLNGYDACRRIRERPWGRDMVMVALTGWGQDEDRRKSHDAGFDHHLVKPVDCDALMKLLAE